MHLPDFVGEIIDTMGLDSSARFDLQNLMNAPDTICFIVDKLNAVPSSIVRSLLFNTFLDAWSQYSKEKVSIFVNCKATEVKSVQEAEGDYRKGLQLKKDHIDHFILTDRMPYLNQNTLFVDPCAAYKFRTEIIEELDSDGNPVFDELTGMPIMTQSEIFDGYEQKMADTYRLSINNSIKRIRDRLYEHLQSDADTLRKNVEELVHLEIIYENRDKIEELTSLRDIIRKEREEYRPRFRGYNIKEIILKKAIDDIHHSTLKKINSLCGGYEQWHIDIYTQIRQAGRECFVGEMNPVEEKLKDLLRDVRDEKARVVTGGYIERLEKMVNTSTKKMSDTFFDWSYNQCFVPRGTEIGPDWKEHYKSGFWEDVNAIHGTGYKKMVRRRYEEQILDDCVMLRDLISDEVKMIMDCIIEFFNEDTAI